MIARSKPDNEHESEPQTTPRTSAATMGPVQLALSSQAAAKALDISERMLFNLSNTGQIRSFRIGRARRYWIAELERFIAERTEAENSTE